MLSYPYLTDLSGDETANQKFVAVAEAYDVLSVEETRKIYDQYGHDGIEQHKKVLLANAMGH